MEFVFYMVIIAAFVYVMTGVVQSTFLSVTPIKREQLPRVIEDEFQKLFPDFATQSISLQKARQRYQVIGKCGGKPSKLVFGVTPESELAVVEYSQAAADHPFVKHRAIASAQVPPKIAHRLGHYLAHDPPLMETGKAESGMIGDTPAYRIEIDSQKYHYQFDITDSGELFKFSKREVA
jgi:hypothetical protein